MSKKTAELINSAEGFDPAGVVNTVVDKLATGTKVNRMTKKPKFDKEGNLVPSVATEYVDLSVATDFVFYALGSSPVSAYYYNPALGAKAKSVAVGVVDATDSNITSLTFARGAKTKTIYANGADVTLMDADSTEIFAGALNKYAYDKKTGAETELKVIKKDVDVTVVNAAVSKIYAGGDGDVVLQGDVTVNLYNAKVSQIYAGGKNGAYTMGDLIVNVSNAGNQIMNGANMVFAATINGTPADKKSDAWGETYVNVVDYTGAYKGSFNYVNTVAVMGNSDVTFKGNFKEVDKISVVGAATANVVKGSAYSYELVLTDETVGGNKTPMLTLSKKATPADVSVVVTDDFAAYNAVTLISWAGYTGKKNQVVEVPALTVKNENGGYVADYQYNVAFGENNNLVFSYTGEAFVLEAGRAGNTDNDFAFGIADDKVIAETAFNFDNVRINLGAGTNELDLANARGNLELTVSTESKNIIDATGFGGDVAIKDFKGMSDAVVVTDNYAGNIQFHKVADAEVIVKGNFAGNVDFSGVENASVLLEDGATFNFANAVAGKKDIAVKIDSYNTATLNGFDIDDYVNAVDYTDYKLEIGENAALNIAGGVAVADYTKNEVVAADKKIYVVGGTLDNNIQVKNGAKLTINNYGTVASDITAQIKNDARPGDTIRDSGSVAINNFGTFAGTIDLAAQAGDDTIVNDNNPATGLKAEFTEDAVISLGAGDDSITLAGDNTFNASVVKLDVVKDGKGSLAIVVKDGVTEFGGSIAYESREDFSEGSVEAADKVAGYDITTLNVSKAVLNIADDTEIIANRVVMDDADINGKFDFKNLEIRNKVVFDQDETFNGYDANGASITLKAGAELEAKNIALNGNMTLENAASVKANDVTAKDVVLGDAAAFDADAVNVSSFRTGNGATVIADYLKADGIVNGDIDINGVVDVEGSVKSVYGSVKLEGDVEAYAVAAKGDVTLTGAEITTTVEGKDVTLTNVTAGDVTATGAAGAFGYINVASITAKDDVVANAAGSLGAVVSSEASVTLRGAMREALVADSVSAKANVALIGDVDVNGNVVAEEGSVTAFGIVDVAEAITAGADVTLSGDVAAKSVTAGANVNVNGDVAVDVAEAITAGADVTLNGIVNAGSIAAGASVFANGTVTTGAVTAANDIVADGVIKAAAVTATTGKVVMAGDVDVADITAGDDVRLTGTVAVKAGNIVSGDNVELFGTVNAGNINAVNHVELNGTVDVQDVTADSLSIKGDKVAVGAVDVENLLDFDAAETIFKKDVTAGEVKLEDQYVEFQANATIGSVSVKEATVATINATGENAALAFGDVTVADKAALELALNGNTATADVELNDNAYLMVGGGALNGNVTESAGDNLTTTLDLRSASVNTVTEVDNILVSGASTIDTLVADKTLAISAGVALFNADEASLEVTNGINLTGSETEDPELAVAGVALKADITGDGLVSVKATDAVITGNVNVGALIAENSKVEGDVTANAVGTNGNVEVTGTVTSNVTAFGTADNTVKVGALDGSFNGNAVNVEIGTMISDNVVSANSVKIGAITAENFTSNISAVNGDLTITDADEATTIAGDVYVMNGNMNIEGAKIGNVVVDDVVYFGNVTIVNEYNVGEETKDITAKFTVNEDWAGKLLVKAEYGNTYVTVNGANVDNFYFEVYGTAGFEFVDTVLGSYVDWALDEEGNKVGINNVEGKYESGTLTFTGDFVGDIARTTYNDNANITIEGNYFGGWTADDDDHGFEMATAYVGSLTVKGNAPKDLLGADFFQTKVYAAAEYTDRVASVAVANAINAFYAQGFTYADVNADTNVTIENHFIGYIYAEGDVTLKSYEGAFSTLAGEMVPAGFDDINEGRVGFDGELKVAGTLTVAGNVLGSKDFYANSDYRDGHDNIRTYVEVINGTTVSVGNAVIGGDFYGNIAATGDVKFAGNIAGGKLTTYGKFDGENVVVEEKFTTADVTVGTFAAEAADQKIWANITANGADKVDEETGDVTAVAILSKSKINGSVNATAGSVDVVEVTGNVTANANATVNGNVGGSVNAGNNATVKGNVGGNVFAGNADVTGNVVGMVSAVVNATVNGNVGYIKTDELGVETIEATSDVWAIFGDAKVTGDYITGNVYAGNDAIITCNKVYGQIEAGNNADVKADVIYDVIAGNDATVVGNVGTTTEVVIDETTKVTVIDTKASVYAGNDATVNGDVTGDVEAGNDATVTGKVYGKVIAGNNATVGVVDKYVIAGATATLSGTVGGYVDATTVKKAEGANGFEVKGTVFAETIELEGIKVGAVDAENGNVTVGDVVDSFTYETSKDAVIVAGKIGGDVRLTNGQDWNKTGAVLNVSMTADAIGTEDKAVKVNIYGLSYLAEKGEDGEVEVNSATTVTVTNDIYANEFNIFGGNLDLTAKTINVDSLWADNSADGVVKALNITAEVNVGEAILHDTNLTVNGNITATGRVAADDVVVNGNAVIADLYVSEGSVKVTGNFVGDAMGCADEGVASDLTVGGYFEGSAVDFNKIEIGGNATFTDNVSADTINFTGADVAINGNGWTVDAEELTFAENSNLDLTNVNFDDIEIANINNFTAMGVTGVKAVQFNGNAVLGDFSGNMTGSDADNKLTLDGVFEGAIDLGAGNDVLDVDFSNTLAGLAGVEEIDIATDVLLTFNGEKAFDLTAEIKKITIATGAGNDEGLVMEGVVINIAEGSEFSIVLTDGTTLAWNGTDSFVSADSDVALKYDKDANTLGWIA